jgi:hypothetical protein
VLPGKQATSLGNKLATNINKKEQMGNKKENKIYKVINKDMHLTSKRKIITFLYRIY